MLRGCVIRESVDRLCCVHTFLTDIMVFSIIAVVATICSIVLKRGVM